MFGGAGFHAMIKFTELGNKLCYLITAALFCPVCHVHPVHPVHPIICDRQDLSVPAKVYLHCPHYELPSS